ncbi:hypothetical protein KW797_03145 [Candidatus Parcubacteria bacterium]|nr:hypothetical protein [Candidatus Parcubacteria bacterium]
MKILLGSQSYQARSKGSTGQRLLNMYAETNPEGSKYPFALYGTPGLTEWADLGTASAVDGMQTMAGSLYAYSNNEVFKVETDATKASIGNLTGSTGRLVLANNGTQMAAVTPDRQAFVTTSAAVARITDSDLPEVSYVTFLDGYHVFTHFGGGQFSITDLYDVTSLDAADFATAEELPDTLTCAIGFNGGLLLPGAASFEAYYNSGNADFPFEQQGGAVNTTRGWPAKFSFAQDDNSMFGLGDDRIVYRLEGYRPVRVSTHAVEAAIDSYETISDAFGFTYTQEGHKFYNLTFPTERATWVLDIATGLWHERGSLGLGLWRANCFSYFAGKNLVGDSVTGKIYELDLDVYTEDGDAIERIIEGSVQWKDGARLTYDMVRLDLDAGVGLITGQGSDPIVQMQFSDDGGRTWSNWRDATMGAIGVYKAMAIWRRCGSSRERIFRFKISDPVAVRITGAYADIRMGKA